MNVCRNNPVLPFSGVLALAFISTTAHAQFPQTAAVFNHAVPHVHLSEDIPQASEGLRPPWTVSNYVWEDRNGNGEMDENPVAGLAGIPVRLLDPVTGKVVAETLTDAAGRYAFKGVVPKPYTVDVSDRTVFEQYGLLRTTNDLYLIRDEELAAPPALRGFGFDSRAGAIGGSLWWDRNANGRRDWNDLPGLLPGSDGLAFVAVRIEDRETGEVVRQSLTDSYGFYVINHLRPGRYRLSIDHEDPDLVRQTGGAVSSADGTKNLLQSSARPTTVSAFDFNLTEHCAAPVSNRAECASIFNVGFAHAEAASVDLRTLDVRTTGRTVRLFWETGVEWDNAGFEVLHSYNYGAFVPIAFLPGRGSEAFGARYDYVMNDQRYGIHRFKLRQSGRHGSVSRSPEIELHLSMDGAFVLDTPEPDPYKVRNTVTFAVSEAQRVQLELHSDLGGPPRVIFDQKLEANEIRELAIDASNLVSGRYYVRMRGESFEGARTVLLRR